MLYALEVPPAGGNTSFCTMYGVYEALPQALKDRVAGLKIKHDGTYNSGGYVRQGVTPTDDRRARDFRVGGAARRTLELRRSAGIRMGARLARRRSRFVG